MLNFFSKNAYELDWGNMTPEGYDSGRNEIIHVFNFNISSTDKIETDWGDLTRKIQVVFNEYFEFFPIPGFSEVRNNYLGISILNKNIPQQQAENLQVVFRSLMNDGYKIFELYGATELTKENIDSVLNKYVKIGSASK